MLADILLLTIVAFVGFVTGSALTLIAVRNRPKCFRIVETSIVRVEE